MVLYLLNFADAEFHENKPARNGKTFCPLLMITDVGKSCQRHDLLTMQICLPYSGK